MKKYVFFVLISFALCSCYTNGINGQSILIDEIEQSFDNIAKIEVEGSFCNVNAVSHDQTNINLKGEILSSKIRDDVKIRHEVNGSTLKVWIDRPNRLFGSVGGTLDFKVPKNTNISVFNSSGSVYVANIGQAIVELKASSGSIKTEKIDSDVSLKTSSGNIKCFDINGSIKAQSSSGSQHFEKISGDLVTTLSSGSAKIFSINGSAKATSSSGSQYYNNIEQGVSGKCSSGTIKIENSKGNILASTSSGGIRLNNIEGTLKLSSSSGSQSGSAITLTGNSRFTASSGSVKMELTNSANDLSFDLKASSGSLKAKGNSGKKTLNMGNGNILVSGVTSSGSQNYR